MNILKDTNEDAAEGRSYIAPDLPRSDVFALARRDLEAASEYILSLQSAGAPRGDPRLHRAARRARLGDARAGRNVRPRFQSHTARGRLDRGEAGGETARRPAGGEGEGVNQFSVISYQWKDGARHPDRKQNPKLKTDN